MPRLRQMSRLLHIHRVFVRYGLEEFFGALHVFGPYRWLLRLFPWQRLRATAKPRALRLREALQDLGPVFVKFGQMLSTRPDLLPEDIALELSQLQDRVPPFPGVQAIAVIEQAYEGKLDAFFRHFDPVPVASASVAQVHFAELLDGTPVAVKVLRPDIGPVIERDLELLYSIARLALRYGSDMQRLRPLEVVEEYSKTLHAEIDLMREAANASQLHANFAGSDQLLVPKVYWDLTRSQVMVMERVSGIPIGNIRALREAGIDMRRLAHAGVEIFFTQAFRDGFFHADMHPGNIFVSPTGQYIAVDFGIMGTLSERDKSYLAENFLAFFNRDYRGVAEAHLHAGWVANDTRLDEFEAAIRTVCEPIFARPLKDISFGRLLLRLFQTARRFNMEVQPQLVLLQKTLFNIEGLGRQLYPDLDLWVTAKPFLEEWMRREIGPRALLRSLRKEIPKWSRTLPELPMLLHAWLRKGGGGELSFQWKSADLEKLRLEMRANHRRVLYAVLGTGWVLSAAVLLAVGTAMGGEADPLWSWLCGGVGMILLMMAWPANNIP